VASIAKKVDTTFERGKKVKKVKKVKKHKIDYSPIAKLEISLKISFTEESDDPPPDC